MSDVVDLEARRLLMEAQRHDDPALREVAITWSQILSKEKIDDAEVSRLIDLAKAILETPATTLSGVQYKLGAVVLYMLARNSEDDVTRQLVESAMSDLSGLTGDTPA